MINEWNTIDFEKSTSFKEIHITLEWKTIVKVVNIDSMFILQQIKHREREIRNPESWIDYPDYNKKNLWIWNQN